MGKVADSFYDDLAHRLGLSAPRALYLAFFHAWQLAEGGSATYNPFNTTQPMPGATWYNSFGPGGQYHVLNYPDQQTGVLATYYTLIGGQGKAGAPSSWFHNNRYSAFLEDAGAGGKDYTPTLSNWAHAIGTSGWGTSESTLDGALKVKPTNQNAGVGADPGVAVPQGITGGAATGIVHGALGWAAALAKLAANLLDPRFWLRIGQGLAAAILLLIGAGLVFRRDAMAAAKIGAVV